MTYAKLVNNVLSLAPRKLRFGTFIIYNPPEQLLESNGYRPVIFADYPEIEEGCIAVPGWEEQENAIVQTWTVTS